jgi:hypothetical protein
MVLKIFDIFTNYTASLLYVITRSFEYTALFKPDGSRPVNSEKYVVGIGYNPKKGEEGLAILESTLAEWPSAMNMPSTLIPSHIMQGDRKFCSSFLKAAREMTATQTKALSNVFSLLDTWLSNPGKGQTNTFDNKGKNLKGGKGKGKGKNKGCKGKGKSGKEKSGLYGCKKSAKGSQPYDRLEYDFLVRNP